MKTVDWTLDELNAAFPETGETMPVVFVGHGNPMNAIEDNVYSRAWIGAGKALPRPRAILSVSAHWETKGSRVTAMERSRTLYTFDGFPEELFRAKYPAPGAPQLAALVQQTLKSKEVRPDRKWGLDHGTWAVLCRLFPAADIPVVQLSLDRTKGAAHHYALAGPLRALRRKGILILGSGNVVHNLYRLVWQERAFDWASEFDETVKRLILSGDHDALVHYEGLGENASLAIPTNEHFLPLLYVLALREEREPLSFFAEGVTLGTISMRAFRIG
jgi:4,5-DOPA dioxygenase extradiol